MRGAPGTQSQPNSARRLSVRLALATVICLAAPLLFLGLNWGLPSRAVDPYLFGDRTPWTGSQIVELAGGWEDDPGRGADVARSPLTGRDHPLILNRTDAERAAIVRRYRLFTYQPDEMITLRALAGMKPSQFQFDPRMYQYGGLWIYPTGALLKVASLAGYVTIRPDLGWYLDHPERFGHMYVIARLYSACWGILGVIAVFAIVRRIAGGSLIPAGAGLCFACMPVVVNGAHEAKPHLAGLVLMLFSVLAAGRYVERGRWSACLLAGVLCGAAVGMVPTAYPIFVILPVMAMLRRADRNSAPRQVSAHRLRITISGVGIGIATYLLTNPYLPFNLLFNRTVLQSNLGNSSQMYHANLSASAILNATRLVCLGTSPVLALAGFVATIALAIRATRKRADQSPSEVRRRALGLLLAVPAAFVAISFCLLAAGKPGEYGRFAMLPDTFLAVEAFVAISTFATRPLFKTAVVAVLVIFTALAGALYLRGFVRDSHPLTSRMRLAEVLRKTNRAGMRTLAIDAEPAPYCLPPVDLFNWQIRLAPRGFPEARMAQLGDIAAVPIDASAGSFLEDFMSTPISWADKRFRVIENPLKEDE